MKTSIIALVAVAALSLVSCSTSDDDTPSVQPISSVSQEYIPPVNGVIYKEDFGEFTSEGINYVTMDDFTLGNGLTSLENLGKLNYVGSANYTSAVLRESTNVKNSTDTTNNNVLLLKARDWHAMNPIAGAISVKNMNIAQHDLGSKCIIAFDYFQTSSNGKLKFKLYSGMGVSYDTFFNIPFMSSPNYKKHHVEIILPEYLKNGEQNNGYTLSITNDSYDDVIIDNVEIKKIQ